MKADAGAVIAAKALSARTQSTRSWTVFFSFGVLLLAYGIYALSLPYLEPRHWHFSRRGRSHHCLRRDKLQV